jgi:hypothetical protein
MEFSAGNATKILQDNCGGFEEGGAEISSDNAKVAR